MRNGWILGAAISLLGPGPATAQAPPATPPAAVTASGCAAGSTAAEDALGRLDRLDAMVESLPPAGPLQPVLDALSGVLATDCFRLAGESPRQPRPDSPTGLLEWWRSGGRGWLKSYVDRPVAGPIDAPQPQLVVPPDTLRTLDLETQPGHPLARYLCRPGDVACGAETRGWRLRAEAAFQNHRSRGLHTLDQDPSFNYTPEGAQRVADSCVAPGQDDASGPEQYGRWRACVEQRRFTRLALPLGAVRAPSVGWLIVEGRRGHYEFCDTVRAFDLKTGAAFLWDSCAGLVLRPDGTVDRSRTDAGRDQRVRQGTVGVEAVREAAWMLLLRAETSEAQLTDQWFPLPVGLQPSLVELPPRGTEDTPVVVLPWNSGQTTLTWRLALADGTGFAGDLTWPSSYDAAEDHAAALLEVAEAGLVEGCAGKPPGPATLRRSTAAALNDLLDDAEPLIRAHFDAAADRWSALRTCRLRRR